MASSFERPVPVEELTTGALAERLRQSSTGELPQEYQVRGEERPTVMHDECAPVPIIDFLEFYTDESRLAAKVGAACRDWGFFQLINHSIPLESISAFRDQGLKFFGMPAEEKKKMITDKNFCQYRANHLQKELGHTNLLWAESLAFKYRPRFNFDKLIERTWPQGNPELRNISLNFSDEVERLGDKLLRLFALSLGLEGDSFSKHFVEKRALFLRWNYYPPCPEPTSALGIRSHTDPFVFTILQEDDVGGLQIKRDGEWKGVKPVEGAVLVNVGDILEAWTNGRFKSVEHRVVVNKEKMRLSVAAFTNPGDVNLSIVSPPELIDESHPPIYRAFTFGEFLTAKYRPSNENSRIPIGHGLKALEKFKWIRSKV